MLHLIYTYGFTFLSNLTYVRWEIFESCVARHRVVVCLHILKPHRIRLHSLQEHSVHPSINCYGQIKTLEFYELSLVSVIKIPGSILDVFNLKKPFTRLQ